MESAAVRLHNEEYVEKSEFTEERSAVFEGRLERATELWDQAKLQFREGKIAQALHNFKFALYHVDFDELSYNFELMDKHRAQVDAVRVPLWLNAAHCICLLHKQGKLDPQALEYCDLALKVDAKNAKALFRRARAREISEQWDLALEDLEKALQQQQGENEEVKKAIRRVKANKAKEQQEMDALWKGKKLFPEITVQKTEKEKEEKQWWGAWLFNLVLWILTLGRMGSTHNNRDSKQE